MDNLKDKPCGSGMRASPRALSSARRSIVPPIAGWVFCMGLVAASGATAQTVGDADAGRALAQRWCTSCHLIDPESQSASAIGVPTFPGIARMVSTTTLSLSVFLQTPHDRMPDLHLSHAEIADVSAFIMSLKPRQ